MVDLLRPPPPSSSEQRSLRPFFCLILFGFPPLFPIWVGRFFIELIIWFSSPTSCLGWEVFYQTSWVRLLSTFLTSLWFSSPVFHQGWEVFYQTHLISFGFTTQYLTGLGGFSSIDLISSSLFPRG